MGAAHDEIRFLERERERGARFLGVLPDAIVGESPLPGQAVAAVQDREFDAVVAPRPDFDRGTEPKWSDPQSHPQFAALLATAALGKKDRVARAGVNSHARTGLAEAGRQMFANCSNRPGDDETIALRFGRPR